MPPSQRRYFTMADKPVDIKHRDLRGQGRASSSEDHMLDNSANSHSPSQASPKEAVEKNYRDSPNSGDVVQEAERTPIQGRNDEDEVRLAMDALDGQDKEEYWRQQDDEYYFLDAQEARDCGIDEEEEEEEEVDEEDGVEDDEDIDQDIEDLDVNFELLPEKEKRH